MQAKPETKLILIKSIHTLIWALFVSIIAFVLWSGIFNNITFYSWLAAASVIAEGIVLAIFGGSCPLTVVARKYSKSTQENFDIYLPNWLAKYNKVIFTSLFLVGLVAMLVRHFS
jgi:hypothetical protein